MDRPTLVGLGVVGVAAILYWLANRYFDAGRGDFFYLADAFPARKDVAVLPARAVAVIPVGDRF